MPLFIDRDAELAFLNNALTRTHPGPGQLIMLYGRRRVGKTALLRYWAEQSGAPFAYWVGVLEVAGAVGLLIPLLSSLAALRLAAVMVGAAMTNQFLLEESPWLPLALLVVAAVIAWARRSSNSILVDILRR